MGVRGFCQTELVTDDSKALHRSALGALLRHWRASQGLSVEALAEQAGIAHTTLRRVEDGHGVQPRTYRSVEEAAKLPAGFIVRALKDDQAAIDLAERLGIAGPDENQSPAAWLRSFAMPIAWSQQLTSQSQPDDLDTAMDLLKRLTARHNRTAVENTTLAAVLALVREWAGVSEDD